MTHFFLFGLFRCGFEAALCLAPLALVCRRMYDHLYWMACAVDGRKGQERCAGNSLTGLFRLCVSTYFLYKIAEPGLLRVLPLCCEKKYVEDF